MPSAGLRKEKTTKMESRERATWECYPFVVHFEEVTAKATYIWTGTILSPYCILTAAHCCFDRNRTQTVDIDTLTLSLFPGDRQLRGSKEICCRIHCHPLYRATDENDPICFDAAIVELNVPIDVEICPSVRLPDQDSDEGARKDTDSNVVIGWNYDMRDKLWRYSIDVHPIQVAGGSPPYLFEGYADARKGDSGGPLLATNNSEWNQVGIHSGRDCSTSRCEMTRIAHPAMYKWMDCIKKSCRRD